MQLIKQGCMLLLRSLIIVITALLMQLMPTSSIASPWLEADDSYLRANLQTLVEAGLIEVPVNTFPILWRSIATDLNSIDTTSFPDYIEHAYQYVKFKYDNAVLGIGTRRLNINYSNETPDYIGFAPVVRGKFDGIVSLEQTWSNFSGRYAYNYGYGTSEKWHHSAKNSYLAAASKYFVISANMIERFWGPGWYYGFAWSQQPEQIPTLEIDFHYDKNIILGKGIYQIFFSRLKPFSTQGYLIANRWSARYGKYLEFGLSHKFTFAKKNILNVMSHMLKLDDVNHLQQATLDARINGHLLKSMTNSIYFELATASKLKIASSWLVGIDGQMSIFNQYLRWYFEKMTKERPYNAISSITDAFVEFKDKSLTDSKLPAGYSLGFLMQLQNYQKLRFTYLNASTHNEKSLIYTFYMQNIELNFGISHSSERNSKNKNKGWVSADYRF